MWQWPELTSRPWTWLGILDDPLRAMAVTSGGKTPSLRRQTPNNCADTLASTIGKSEQDTMHEPAAGGFVGCRMGVHMWQGVNRSFPCRYNC